MHNKSIGGAELLAVSMESEVKSTFILIHAWFCFMANNSLELNGEEKDNKEKW